MSVFRRAVCVAGLVLVASSPAHAQAACDQLVPFGLFTPAAGFEYGCSHPYDLRLGTISPLGDGLMLAYPECANGPCAGLVDLDLFVCAARDGYSCCVVVGDALPIPAGTLMGPLQMAVSQRIAGDSDTRTDICNADYAGDGSRLGVAPLILPPGNGLSVVQVVGFVRVFFVGLGAVGTSGSPRNQQQPPCLAPIPDRTMSCQRLARSREQPPPPP